MRIRKAFYVVIVMKTHNKLRKIYYVHTTLFMMKKIIHIRMLQEEFRIINFIY